MIVFIGGLILGFGFGMLFGTHLMLEALDAEVRGASERANWEKFTNNAGAKHERE